MTHDSVPPAPVQGLTADRARAVVVDAILAIVPDADLDSIGDDVRFRSELELDSLDFLAFVERVSQASGVRIDEADYPRLATIGSCVAFLGGH
jgi:acyl carrier protein